MVSYYSQVHYITVDLDLPNSENFPLTIFNDTTTQIRNLPENTHENVSKILFYTHSQNELTDATNELSSLLDQLISYRETPSTISVAKESVPVTMARLMRSRERAKRVYRNALGYTFEDELEWNHLEKLFNNLQEELFKTDEFLSLHPGRGIYH
ncbi:hypothetical protein C6P45_003286 [Maudiozyma exigua]|uniref:Uncharacterized protein n=1 Tax=Maudiozyma exigua TaxID=34358 RepID=A0A9P6VV97_MAUEX|nr:hypothetical protein C6P45_003286 [Kazachstania exigua]